MIRDRKSETGVHESGQWPLAESHRAAALSTAVGIGPRSGLGYAGLPPARRTRLPHGRRATVGHRPYWRDG
jgi:hypothetical protein